MKKIELMNDVTLSEVKKILSERSKVSDLNYEQDLGYKHAKEFAELTTTKAKKMKEELIEKAEISDEVACKLVDVLPTKEQLDLIAEKNKSIDDTNKKTILEIIDKYKK